MNEPGESLYFLSDPSELPHFDVEPYNDEPALVHSVSRLDRLQVQTRGATEHAHQRSLIKSNDIFAASVAAKLREFGRTDLSEPLEKCHTERTHKRCSGCQTVSTFYNRCDLFYCPRCQPRLARERAQSVEFWAKEVAQPKHVVLTIGNTMSLTKHHVKHILKSFVRLRRSVLAKKKTFWWTDNESGEVKRLRRWREDSLSHTCVTSHPWVGGFFRLEVTNEGKGWHLHVHALVDSRFIDARALSFMWHRASRQTGHIVKVKDARDRDYLKEVTKYAVKGSDLADWSAEDIASFVDAFEGFRTFGVFGSLYGKRSEWKEFLSELAEARQACPCGCNQYRLLSDDELEWEQCVAGSRPPPVTPCAKAVEHPEFAFALSALDVCRSWA